MMPTNLLVRYQLRVSANALTASANIFEVKSDIDARFGRIADKECDTICADVRKWFKKLAVCFVYFVASLADGGMEWNLERGEGL